MSEPLVIVGLWAGDEFDAEIDDGPRLAVGLLGTEVRDRWGCTRCGHSGCIVYVERYDESGQGSTFALCATCAFDVLDPRPMRAAAASRRAEPPVCSTADCNATARYEAEIEDVGWHPYCDGCVASMRGFHNVRGLVAPCDRRAAGECS